MPRSHKPQWRSQFSISRSGEKPGGKIPCPHDATHTANITHYHMAHEGNVVGMRVQFMCWHCVVCDDVFLPGIPSAENPCGPLPPDACRDYSSWIPLRDRSAYIDQPREIF